jgi:hypothetical protein
MRKKTSPMVWSRSSLPNFNSRRSIVARTGCVEAWLKTVDGGDSIMEGGHFGGCRGAPPPRAWSRSTRPWKATPCATRLPLYHQHQKIALQDREFETDVEDSRRRFARDGGGACDCLQTCGRVAFIWAIREHGMDSISNMYYSPALTYERLKELP